MKIITYFEVMYDEDHDTDFCATAQEAIDTVEQMYGEGGNCAMQCDLHLDKDDKPIKLVKTRLANCVDGEFALTKEGRVLVNCEHEWKKANPSWAGADQKFEFCLECSELREV